MNIDKNAQRTGDKLFTLKKWNAVAMWSWDVECDTCAICRVQVMGKAISSGDIWEILIIYFLLNFEREEWGWNIYIIQRWCWTQPD